MPNDVCFRGYSSRNLVTVFSAVVDPKASFQPIELVDYSAPPSGILMRAVALASSALLERSSDMKPAGATSTNMTAPMILSQRIIGNRKHMAAAKNRPRLTGVTLIGKKSAPWIATARAE